MHGCGGVGLSALQIAAAAGARVIGVDVSPGARALAREMGAEHTVDGADDVPAAVADLTGAGAHVSLDTLGAAVTCINSSAACGRAAGTCRWACCRRRRAARRSRWSG